MAPNSRGQRPRRHPKPQHTRNRQLKRKRDVEDVEQLNKRVSEFTVNSSSPPELFTDLPLSQPTLDGLEASHFKTLTDVQAQAIPVALQGKDMLCSARTGSGKSLAFLLPCLDNLYRKRWAPHDGTGILVLSPTRELAAQLFKLLRSVGVKHTFSAGLLVGGRSSFEEERDRLHNVNFIISTPGRALAHLDQNSFDVSNLSMLVLDECDAIMDAGFEKQVNAIIEHLPKVQTLLFSATVTKKVSDLHRLRMKDPEFISVHEESEMPSQLQQNYVITALSQKIDTLWSFIRSNTQKKLLIFVATTKFVRLIYETFRHLKPGIPLMHLYGRQSQTTRLEIYQKYCHTKNACLISTDLASRGLDFPTVDFVVQLDAPDSIDSYIHRSGRTARYNSSGKCVLFLDPSEAPGMLDVLNKKKVNIEEIHVRQNKMQHSIQNQLANMLLKDPALKYLAQTAFISYCRSIFIQKDKNIFDIKKYDLEAFATSLGLPGAPRVKFIKGEDAKKIKNMSRTLAAIENESSDDHEDGDDTGSKAKEIERGKPVRTKYDRMFGRLNQDVLSKHFQAMIDDGEDDSSDNSDDDLMVVKARYNGGERLGGIDEIPPSQTSDSESGTESVGEDYASQTRRNGTSTAVAKSTTSSEYPTMMKKEINLSTNPSEPSLIIDSKRREKLLKGRKALLKYKGSGSHVVFDEEGDDNYGKEKVYYEDEKAFTEAGATAAEQRQNFLEAEKEKAKVADDADREVARAKRREKKIKRKEKEKQMLAEDDGQSDDDDAGVQLLPYEGDLDRGLDDGLENDADDNEDDATAEPVEKKRRKWFEDTDSEEEDIKSKKKQKKDKRRQRAQDMVEQPQTLEDLEAMAMGLLAK